MRRMVTRASVLLVAVALVVGCSTEDDSGAPEGIQDLTDTTTDDTTGASPNGDDQPTDTDTDDVVEDDDDQNGDDTADGDGTTDGNDTADGDETTDGDGQDGGEDSDEDSGDFTVDEVDDLVNPLLAVQSEVLREIISDDPGDGLDEDQTDQLSSVLSGPEFGAVGVEYQGYATSDSARDNLVDPDDLGEITWATERVMRAEDDACVVAIGNYDLEEVFSDADPDLLVILSLSADGSDEDDPWRLHDLNVLTSEGEPVPEEDWDNINYDEVLQTTCS